MKIKSVKEESIIKRFSIFFVVASVIPLIILFYLLYQVIIIGKTAVSEFNFKFLLFLVAIFALLGFWGTRSFLIKIASFTKKLKDDPLAKIDKSTILKMAKEGGEIAYLAKIFGDVTSKLEENVTNLEETKRTLHRVLAKIGKAIGSAENFEVLIRFILETMMEALGAKKGAIYILDEEKKVLKPKVTLGIDENHVPLEIKFGDGTVGWVAKEGKPLLIPALEEEESKISLFAPPLIAAPLIVHDKTWGAVCLSDKIKRENFSEEELKILSNLAYQIAVALENAKLSAAAERIYFETMSALALAVEAKDHYSRGHQETVGDYAIKIAGKMGLAQSDLETLRDASKLHDIGKIGIVDEILQKPGKLSDEEMAIMRKHPVIGEGIVKPLKSFSHIIDPIRHHHEFLDGSGYPDGLKGEQIPLVTRILTVADVFDAMISDRPYRKALSMDQTKKELQVMVEKGKIDKDVVSALFALIEANQI